MRALVLSGGGSRGAFQAGVIRALTEAGRRWDVIAGVSVGALNAAYMAQFKVVEQKGAALGLKDFWDQIKGNSSIYKRWFPFGRAHALWKGGLYDTSPLAKTVKYGLDLDRLNNSDVKLLVGAVCLETGGYEYVEGAGNRSIVNWVLASAAFPVAFPPVKLGSFHFVDGGVRDITPITDIMALKPDEVDVVLTGPLGRPVDGFAAKKAANAIEVALRAGALMADEVFNSDLDRVSAADRRKIKVYAPPESIQLPDPLDFNPADISRLYEVGSLVGA